MNGPRRQAREAALQILYFWEVGGADPREAIAAFFEEHQPGAPDEVVRFATALVLGTVAEVSDLDRAIERHSQHWRIARLAVVDRLILRMALWELRHPDDAPEPVILNEGLELARRFSTEDAVKFINGVLDAIRRDEAGHASE